MCRTGGAAVPMCKRDGTNRSEQGASSSGWMTMGVWRARRGAQCCGLRVKAARANAARTGRVSEASCRRLWPRPGPGPGSESGSGSGPGAHSRAATARHAGRGRGQAPCLGAWRREGGHARACVWSSPRVVAAPSTSGALRGPALARRAMVVARSSQSAESGDGARPASQQPPVGSPSAGGP